MKTRTVFLDGKIIVARQDLIDALAPGVVSGKGVFETMRADNGVIIALNEHFCRLFRGLRLLKIRPPCTETRMRRHLKGIIIKSGLRSAKIRLAVWRDHRRVRMAIVCQNAPRRRNGQAPKCYKAIVSAVRRPMTRFSHIKSLDYQPFLLAYQEAQRKACDESILLNTRGELVEGSRTNVFFVKRKILYTPMVKCGCLNGVTRQIIRQCAREMNIPCRAVRAGRQQLMSADEAFVTNSLIGVVPLTRVDRRPIDTGRVGAMTKVFMKAYARKTHCACPAQDESV